MVQGELPCIIPIHNAFSFPVENIFLRLYLNLYEKPRLIPFDSLLGEHRTNKVAANNTYVSILSAIPL
jgi:hypothetical protein